jgi:predicted branched-subunit amino acid permease
LRILRALQPGDLRDALLIGAAVGLVGAAFGALAASAGLPLVMIMAMSLLVLAGGSQFLVVAVIAAGGGVWPGVAGGLLLNARHLPFGLALGEVVGRSWPARLLGAHLLIDEVVAFARARRHRPDALASAHGAYWVCGIALIAGWNLGTLAGALAGAAVPDPGAFGVDAAFPAALLALVLPTLRQADARRVGLLGALVAVAATPWLPPGLPVLLGLLGLLAAGRGRSEPAAPTP